ncbi:hypothetical protein OsI_05479 [Oryza sativa Indica Group]|uniref:Uncharacterized protein n=1 Tax=Oryza sativa subsp. indica TaxID=39946 RepID=A2WZT6_ORYSI|nr:hypothetical protein OsI_05479 [Oryza sativa Indica Group]
MAQPNGVVGGGAAWPLASIASLLSLFIRQQYKYGELDSDKRAIDVGVSSIGNGVGRTSACTVAAGAIVFGDRAETPVPSARQGWLCGMGTNGGGRRRALWMWIAMVGRYSPPGPGVCWWVLGKTNRTHGTTG